MPYLAGEDLNDSPTMTAPRWVINFFDWSEERAITYPDCYSILEALVKPERAKNTRKPRREYWWRYAEAAPKLYRTIGPLNRALAICLTSKVVMPIFVPTSHVFANTIGVFAYDDDFHFGVLGSSFHYRWAVRYASTMRTDTRYTTSDVFETFPQPLYSAAVETAGRALDEHRASLMTGAQEGLTKTYNRFHSPEDKASGIAQLRKLHGELDYAMRDAYRWQDLGDLGHGFHEVRGQGIRFTFAPEIADEILDRLLELNKERYLAEVAAGLHQKKKQTKKSTTESLFGDMASEDDA